MEPSSNSKYSTYSLDLTTTPLQIPITRHKMNQLAHHSQNFTQVFSTLISDAAIKFNDDPKEALVYLAEAQRLLQYVASCGMNIDKKMIILVLHNQACCYQQLWQLTSCLNYLQALIYNFCEDLTSKKSTPINPVSHMTENRRKSSQYEGKPMINRIQLCQYYLQYSAIHSESGNHIDAKKSALNALWVIRQIFNELQASKASQASIIQGSNLDYQERINILKMIGSLSKLPQSFESFERNNLILTLRHYTKEWTRRKQLQNCSVLKQHIDKFSIGHIMKIRFLSLENITDIQHKSGFYTLFPEQYLSGNNNNISNNLLNTVNMVNLTHHILLLVISLFTLATQIRLMVIERYGDNKDKLKGLAQYEQSQKYTLASMIILLIYVPYETFLIKHFFTSYTSNYRDIFNDEIGKGKILKSQFNACMLGNKMAQKSDDLTTIYKKDQLLKLTDDMKTVNFVSRHKTENSQKRSKSKSISSRLKNSKQILLRSERKFLSPKNRSKSETFKRYSLNNRTENLLNKNIHIQNQGTLTMQVRKKPNKKRSFTTFKNNHKIDKKLSKSKNIEEKKQQSKRQKNSEYFECVDKKTKIKCSIADHKSPISQHKSPITKPKHPTSKSTKKEVRNITKVLSPKNKLKNRVLKKHQNC